MTRLARIAILAAMTLGAGGAAQAAPPSAAPHLGAVSADASLLQDVRYVTQCRPVVVNRYDRRGRPVQVTRSVCQRVWVGRGRGYRY